MNQNPSNLNEEEIGRIILDSAFKVHTALGPGLLESVYEAALANNPPSGTIYKPDGVRLQSLGVHEYWNNATDKKYSRNLGTDDGIELVTIPEGAPAANITKPTGGS